MVPHAWSVLAYSVRLLSNVNESTTTNLHSFIHSSIHVCIHTVIHSYNSAITYTCHLSYRGIVSMSSTSSFSISVISQYESLCSVLENTANKKSCQVHLKTCRELLQLVCDHDENAAELKTQRKHETHRLSAAHRQRGVEAILSLLCSSQIHIPSSDLFSYLDVLVCIVLGSSLSQQSRIERHALFESMSVRRELWPIFLSNLNSWLHRCRPHTATAVHTLVPLLLTLHRNAHNDTQHTLHYTLMHTQVRTYVHIHYY